MRTLSLNIKNKSLAQEAINCWLRYTLSQPVSIDISILMIFAVQYFGLPKLVFLLQRIQELTVSSVRALSEKLMLNEPLTYGLERV